MYILKSFPFDFSIELNNELETAKKNWQNGLQIRGTKTFKHYCFAFKILSKGFLLCYSPRIKNLSLDIFKLI
jgi:hypothetical protein